MASVNSEHSVPQIHLESFDGPLDLLLFLIKKDEISIYDIPIHLITSQYISYMQTLDERDLEQMSEFYTMASTLLLIKSKMLVPSYSDDGELIEDPRKDLVEKLIEYQKYKKLSELLMEIENEVPNELFRKTQEYFIIEPEQKETSFETKILIEYFGKIMKSLSHDKVISLFEEVSVNEKIALIMEFLETKIEFSLTELITRPKSLIDLICSFLAILECAKTHLIHIEQDEIFGDIRIRRRIESLED